MFDFCCRFFFFCLQQICSECHRRQTVFKQKFYVISRGAIWYVNWNIFTESKWFYKSRPLVGLGPHFSIGLCGFILQTSTIYIRLGNRIYFALSCFRRTFIYKRDYIFYINVLYITKREDKACKSNSFVCRLDDKSCFLFLLLLVFLPLA